MPTKQRPTRARTDAVGRPADQNVRTSEIDPTENVLALVKAAVERLDDMSGVRDRLYHAELHGLENIIDLRASHAKEIRSMEDLIRTIESGRLNAIRQNDQLAVQNAAVEAKTAIQALAAITTSNADTVRNALTNTATTIAAQFSETVSGITSRIAALEKSSYEGAGKQAVVDPAIGQLTQRVEALMSARATTTGMDQGKALIVGAIVLVLGLLFAGTSAVVAIYALRPPTTDPAVAQLNKAVEALAARAAVPPQAPIYLQAQPGTLIPSPATNPAQTR